MVRFFSSIFVAALALVTVALPTTPESVTDIKQDISNMVAIVRQMDVDINALGSVATMAQMTKVEMDSFSLMRVIRDGTDHLRSHGPISEPDAEQLVAVAPSLKQEIMKALHDITGKKSSIAQLPNGLAAGRAGLQAMQTSAKSYLSVMLMMAPASAKNFVNGLIADMDRDFGAAISVFS
ncbi:hypothetical protein AX16_001496 [Volvariella volvacea WC 439]|nr:hypothetical protein AX16_001496 [Volvariella volvacea WC 439]